MVDRFLSSHPIVLGQICQILKFGDAFNLIQALGIKNFTCPMILRDDTNCIPITIVLLQINEITYRLSSLIQEQGIISTFTEAAENGNGQSIFYLFENGINEFIDVQNEFGNTALLCAVQRGRREITKFLINRGANMDIQNMWGHTALMCAVQRGDFSTASFLLEAGANPNIMTPHGYTAIWWAFNFSNTKIIDLLKGYGAR